MAQVAFEKPARSVVVVDVECTNPNDNAALPLDKFDCCAHLDSGFDPVIDDQHARALRDSAVAKLKALFFSGVVDDSSTVGANRKLAQLPDRNESGSKLQGGGGAKYEAECVNSGHYLNRRIFKRRSQITDEELKVW